MTQTFLIAGGDAVGAALARAVAALDAADIDTARLDSRLLLAEVLGGTAEHLVAWPERVLSAAEACAFSDLLRRRAAGEPVAQIVGVREFWSLPFVTTRDTLTPRPDSETVIDAALALFPDRGASLRILDLGTGTGCLLLALLSEYPQATGVGTDLSAAAMGVATRNAATLGLARRAAFIATCWDDAVTGLFDLVVSNPPYIRTAELCGLAPEVRLFEPRLALDGGDDGLRAYRMLAPRLMRRIRPGGLGIVEVGATQAEAVERLLLDAGLTTVARRCDLSGIERCVLVRR